MPRRDEVVGMPFRTAITDYMENGFHGKALSTIRVNDLELTRFLRWGTRHWATPSFGVEQIKEGDMAAFLEPRRPPRKSATTFNNCRQVYVRFFKYARAEGWIERDPMRREESYKVKPKQKLWLSATDLQAMLEGADARDRMALAFGIHTGLRAQDAMAIKIGDLDLRGGSFEAWIQKTSQWSTKPLTAELRTEVLTWLAEYARQLGLPSMRDLNDSWRLIPRVHPVAVGDGTPGFKIGRATRLFLIPDQHVAHPERIVHRALDRIGIPPEAQKGCGFHTLRRSAARLLYDVASGDPVNRDATGTVQAWLDHAKRETTEIYIGMKLQQQEMDAILRGKMFLARAVAIETARWKDENDEGGSAGLALAR